jgi:hypothetical protein
MLHQDILRKLFISSCIIYGLFLAGCDSNDYDNSLDTPATTVSPAHGDKLVPDTNLSGADTSMHGRDLLHSNDSLAVSSPKDH